MIVLTVRDVAGVGFPLDDNVEATGKLAIAA
jgi:hypothetical protein